MPSAIRSNIKPLPPTPVTPSMSQNITMPPPQVPLRSNNPYRRAQEDVGLPAYSEASAVPGIRGKLPQYEITSKGQPLGLNLITNFSKNPRQQTQEPAASKQQPKKDPMKGPIGSLRRTGESPMSALSPSDRTLVFGMDMPPEVKEIFERGGLDAPQTKELRPEIIITPAAQTQNPWSNPPNAFTKNRPKIVSGVYSPAASFVKNTAPGESPMPTAKNNKFNDKLERPRSRVTSWGTEFDEDESPVRPRSFSAERQLRTIRPMSIDTVATNRRSNGWWNQVLSPFLERSNTVATRLSPIDDDKTPLSPTRSQSLGRLSPSAVRRTSGRSSIWTDMSRWEAERKNKAFMLEDGPTGLPSNNPTLPDEKILMSPSYHAVGGFGLAAEYFEASIHDENSSTKYFECQNHDCSMLKSTLASAPRIEGARDIAADLPTVNRVQASSGFGPFEDDREISAKDANQKKVPPNLLSRSVSDATEIDDEPSVEEDIGHLAAKRVRLKRGETPQQPPAPNAVPKAFQSTRGINAVSVDKDAVKNESTLPASQILPTYLSPRPERSQPPEVHLPANPRPGNNRPMARQAVAPLLEREDTAEPFEPKAQGIAATPPPVAQTTYNVYYNFGKSAPTPNLESLPKGASPKPDNSKPFFPPPPRAWTRDDEKRYMKEKREDEKSLKKQVLKAEAGSRDAKAKKKRRCAFIWILSGLLAIVILVVVLVMTLTRKESDMPVQSSWLNITGYPPIPTGIATIARPDAVVENSACVHPATMWSCAVPKEDQSALAPNDPDQPNFRVEIRFQNGSYSTPSTNVSKTRRSSIGAGNPISAMGLIRDRLLRARDTFTDTLFTPSPAPPSEEDQSFLGNTTDGNHVPFDGEFTPFFISFLPTTVVSASLDKRQDTSNSSSTNADQFPNITDAIPPPAIGPDGTAADANLLSFPTSQPIRLYNRGLSTEHYGFYSYYDRSIFLKSTALLTTDNADVGEVPDDLNGGSPKDAATVRCTWAQTRFRVQIWTNMQSSAALLSAANGTTSTSSSADDFSRPGSFPYPVTVTLDRHGGDPTLKSIYCYGIDDREHIETNAKKFQLENRGAGGVLVNPTQGVFGAANASLADGGPGGVDGGTGGCSCQWQNWVNVQK